MSIRAAPSKRTRHCQGGDNTCKRANLKRHNGQDSIQQKTEITPVQPEPLQQGPPSQKLLKRTYKNKVEERGLVDTNKLTVPAADLVFGLRRFRQLVVVLHVLNHLGQDTGIHVLKRDLVLPVRHVCKTAESTDNTQRKHSAPAQHQNISPSTFTHQLRFAGENCRAWEKTRAPQARAAPTTAGQSAQFKKSTSNQPVTQTPRHDAIGGPPTSGEPNGTSNHQAANHRRAHASPQRGTNSGHTTYPQANPQ